MSDPVRKAEKAALKAEADARYATALADLPMFIGFGKISRLNRDITITEKLDGTNAAIGIGPEEGAVDIISTDLGNAVGPAPYAGKVWAQSRTRVITPEQDNMGFARWVEENKEDLRRVLGPGLHFGEWWGGKIQRGYGMTGKKFSLFNFTRWANDPSVHELARIGVQVIPVLYHGPWNTSGQYLFAPDCALKMLAQRGSFAQPGYKLEPAEPNSPGSFQERFTGKWFKRGVGPEGIVVYHKAGGVLFKATLEGDEHHKFELTNEQVMTGVVSAAELAAAALDDELNPNAEDIG